VDDLDIATVVTIVVGVALALVVLVAIARTVRIVSQANAGIVERLGRYHKTLDPGLHFLFPFIDQMRHVVDLREQVVAFPPQPVITQDNVTISIDTVFYFTVTDPFRATYEVAQLLTAIEQLTVTTLRNVIGSLSLEETLTSRDKINADLRIVLDEATERWGLRVNRIELKSIDPPGSIQEAMEKQMRAERDKRAAILTAEGVKQSQILTAEGEKQAAILSAEGEKEAAILRAQGEAEATRQVFQAIHDGDPSPDLLTYQYIQNLPQVANGQGMTLLLVPSDAIASMGAITALGSALQAAKGSTASGPPDDTGR
jgi:regulator of protease activity HflC (stomatin/prohibitin superfamily)